MREFYPLSHISSQMDITYSIVLLEAEQKSNLGAATFILQQNYYNIFCLIGIIVQKALIGGQGFYRPKDMKASSCFVSFLCCSSFPFLFLSVVSCCWRVAWHCMKRADNSCCRLQLHPKVNVSFLFSKFFDYFIDYRAFIYEDLQSRHLSFSSLRNTSLLLWTLEIHRGSRPFSPLSLR